MYKYNLIYYPIIINNKKYYGFIDTGGGKHFYLEIRNYSNILKKQTDI